MVDLRYVFTRLTQENELSASDDDKGNVSTSWMNREKQLPLGVVAAGHLQVS